MESSFLTITLSYAKKDALLTRNIELDEHMLQFIDETTLMNIIYENIKPFIKNALDK